MYCSRVSGLSCIVALGLRLACLRNATATLARCSRVAPNSCMYRRVRTAISSTGRSTPNGRLHCQWPVMRRFTYAHGRLPLAARLRARHATATLHCRVATAIAAWPTVPHPAPPPYPTSEKTVMSPRPTLRATSTSRPSSIENIARPSTSAGAMPASSTAAEIAWHASDSSESGSPLANAVWPMPTIAVRSVSVPAIRRLPGRDSSARELPTLELGGTALDEARPPLLHVPGAGHQLLGVRLVPERAGTVGLEGAVGEPLRERDGASRHLGEAAGPLAERLLELGAWSDLVGQTDALGLGRRHVVPEEEQLLRLLRSDPTRQQVRATGVRDDRAADEHLDEARFLRHDHEAAREGEVHASAGCGPVDARDHRLLAVEDGRNEALEPTLNGASTVADDHVGRAGRPLQRRAGLTQVGAGAEPLLAGPGDDDGAHLVVDRRVLEPLDDLVPHRDGHGVAGVGSVQRDPEHAVLQPAPDVLDRFVHVRTTRASRATAPRGRTINGLTSSSRTSWARSIARRCTFMMTSTRASTSTGFCLRDPSRSGNPRSSRTMRSASSRPKGGTRNDTSRNTSTNTPPSPTMTTGPKRGSRDTPTTVSTPLLTVSQTSTPSTRPRLPAARPALRISSS